MKATSQIYKEYLSGTMEEWCVKCPCCGRFQPYEWRRIRLSDVTMRCMYCDEYISEIDWKQSEHKYIAEHPERHRRRSFHLNELASPWVHWQDIAYEWRDANKDKKITATQRNCRHSSIQCLGSRGKSAARARMMTPFLPAVKDTWQKYRTASCC